MPCAELNASNCKTWFLPWKLDLFLERRGTIALISVTRLRLFSDISALLLKSYTLSDAGFAGVRATIGSNGKFAELRVRRCSNSSSCRIKTLPLCLTRAPQRVSQSSLRVFFYFVSVLVPLCFRPCGNKRVAAQSAFQSWQGLGEKVAPWFASHECCGPAVPVLKCPSEGYVKGTLIGVAEVEAPSAAMSAYVTKVGQKSVRNGQKLVRGWWEWSKYNLANRLILFWTKYLPTFDQLLTICWPFFEPFLTNFWPTLLTNFRPNLLVG